MRKIHKQEILGFINSLYQAHDEIKSALDNKNLILVQNMICECQEFAVSLGENIEKFEGEGHIVVTYIEEYCEILFHLFEDITCGNVSENKVYKTLKKQLIKIENSVKNDIKLKKEMVFFPYKVSMWDSLESIYLAAREDPDCDAYCVPIPYFEVNPDGSLGRMLYEGRDYSKDIEVIDWKSYKLEERKPDVVYIHNPYDSCNLVTSVHPRYYSDNLKKYTDCLVYVPYYSTSGGMSESQRLCPAYINVDYIVIQAPAFRDYFDEKLPDKKFLPFGSPKLDKIIKKCQNPAEPPIEWKKKMEGRKVYFYNTSINGMLGDTEVFLRKLEYVFNTFKGRNDSCILWRPHPLLESTFDSMRCGYKPAYMQIKKYFIENDIGIFDDTPDMTDAIAWSDAYIGDAGTSVTSLFGIVGKPLFILNNRIHSAPEEDSWRGSIVGTGFKYFEKDRYAITQGNKLYISEPYKYDYKYFCDLSEYSGGGYYLAVREVNGKRYVCPRNAQDILLLGDGGIERKIELKKWCGSNGGAFCNAWVYGKYLLLIPFKYPALVRYNTENGEIRYLEDNIDVFVGENERNEKVMGGIWCFDNTAYISSPTDSRVYMLDIESGSSKVMELPANKQNGCIEMLKWEDSIWMLPRKGQTILKWNPTTGSIREYTGFPENFRCSHPIYKTWSDEYPVSIGAFVGKTVYLVPRWGNMGLKLDMETGIFKEWELPIPYKESKEYFYTTAKYSVVWSIEDKDKYKLFYWPERKLYDFDIEKNECKEIEIKFNREELQLHEKGFNDDSQWMKYCCHENAFNSLGSFLDGNVIGRQHDQKEQLRSYGELAANSDGSCGEKVYEFIKALG